MNACYSLTFVIRQTEQGVSEGVSEFCQEYKRETERIERKSCGEGLASAWSMSVPGGPKMKRTRKE